MHSDRQFSTEVLMRLLMTFLSLATLSLIGCTGDTSSTQTSEQTEKPSQKMHVNTERPAATSKSNAKDRQPTQETLEVTEADTFNPPPGTFVPSGRKFSLDGPFKKRLRTKTSKEDILRRYGVAGSHEIDKTKLYGPDDHRRLANIYFAEGNPKEAYRHLEEAALYLFGLGSELGEYHEDQKDYRKAYLYFALSRPDPPKEYNAEKFKALHPSIARLFPHLNPIDHEWVEREIKRHIDTREIWLCKQGNFIKYQHEVIKKRCIQLINQNNKTETPINES